MIITDQFVYIHFPKHGGTFVTSVMERLYTKELISPNKYIRYILKSFAGTSLYSPPEYINLKVPTLNDRLILKKTKHGHCCQIPKEHQDKEIWSVMRNPVDRYVSNYRFQWWLKVPNYNTDAAKARFSNWPEISFNEYVQFVYQFYSVDIFEYFKVKIDIGLDTLFFIRFFFKNPQQVLAIIDEDYIESGSYKKDMYPVVFMEQENLASELIHNLERAGVPRKKLQFIKGMERQNTSRSPRDHWHDYLDAETKKYILHRERLLFKIFPQYYQAILNDSSY